MELTKKKLIEQEKRYLTSLKERFACPVLKGMTVCMKECILIATEIERQSCRETACASPGRICPDCLDQGEKVDPRINRIDCFIFDGNRCDFHQRHGSKASRDEMLKQSIKNLQQKNRQDVEKEYYFMSEAGVLQPAPEWLSAVYALPLLPERDAQPETYEMTRSNIVVSIEAGPSRVFGASSSVAELRQWAKLAKQAEQAV